MVNGADRKGYPGTQNTRHSSVFRKCYVCFPLKTDIMTNNDDACHCCYAQENANRSAGEEMRCILISIAYFPCSFICCSQTLICHNERIK